MVVRFACLAALLLIATKASATEIWMAAFEPVWRQIHHWPPNDYMEFFHAGSPWPRVAHAVKAFEFTEKFIETATDAELETVIVDLKRRHIDLAMMGLPLVATNVCGRAIEGYGPPHDMARAALRVKAHGGTIAYVELDEPLYYGHRFDGRVPLPYETYPPIPCHSSIADLAAQSAGKIAELRAVFPDAKIGDVEPVGVYPSSADLAADLAEWISAYRGATGRPLAFFDIDVAWLLPQWPEQFKIAAAAARQAGIPLGVIYNGSRRDLSDATWLASAESHIRLVESMPGGKPERAFFDTWTDNPRKMLPETSPETFTGLIRRYIEAEGQ